MRFWLITLITFCNGALAIAQGPTAGDGAKLPLAPTPGAGFLLVPGNNLKDGAGRQASPYYPQPGDIVLYDQNSKMYHALFKFAGTDGPTHTAIVIARNDGTPGLLDITGDMLVTAKVGILDILPRFGAYPGNVTVRRLREPLTPEQSRSLTRFAESQAGKGLAVGRLLLFVTPFSPRKGSRPASADDFNRRRWYCSEMVVAAGVAAHIFDPAIHHPHGTCPRDLAYDETMDLSSRYFPPATWVADGHPAK